MAKQEPEIARSDIEAFRSKHKSVQDWLNKLTRSDETRYHYLRDLVRYCRTVGVNPDELLEERRNDKLHGTHEAEKRLDDFVANAPFPHQAKWRVAFTVKSFFKGNYEDLSKGSGKISFQRQKPIRCPESFEIELMARDAPLRDKVLLKLLRDTGMREASVARLRWSHLWDELFDTRTGSLVWDHVRPVHIRLTSTELKGRYSEVEQHSFLTPETVELLLQYKKFREDKGEKISKESFLFVRDRRKGRRYLPLTRKGIIYVVRDASQRVDKDRVYSPHDFRRFAQTVFERARIQPNWVRKLLGRKIRGEEDPYSRPKIDDLRNEFARAIPLITQVKTAEMQSVEIEKLRAELAEFKKDLDWQEEHSRFLFEVLHEANPKVFDKLIDTKGMAPEFQRIVRKIREKKE